MAEPLCPKNFSKTQYNYGVCVWILRNRCGLNLSFSTCSLYLCPCKQKKTACVVRRGTGTRGYEVMHVYELRRYGCMLKFGGGGHANEPDLSNRASPNFLPALLKIVKPYNPCLSTFVPIMT